MNEKEFRRFIAKVDLRGPDDCWLWKASTTTDGYGQLRIGGAKGLFRRAHRLGYVHWVGDIPEGLVLDHLCRQPLCVNPRHLEPVTIGENVKRGIPFAKPKTHCKRGHAYDEKNTYWDPRGRYHCRICVADSKRRYLERLAS